MDDKRRFVVKYAPQKEDSMKCSFYGRDEQIADLERLWGKRTSSFVTCRGRRRIGKSTLIERFAEVSGARFIMIEGLRPTKNLSNEAELAHFSSQLTATVGRTFNVPSNWLNAFLDLDSAIGNGRRTVVLLDEISWMAHYDPSFAGTLKTAWDRYLKKHPKLIFVVCGSVSSWIRENIIDDGAFFGRRSLDIVVPELPLAECVKFWGKSLERLDLREVIDILSVVGGIPRYLEELTTANSANENIRSMAFRPKSILRTDFDEMFQDVITRQPTMCARIIRLLVGDSMSSAEIADRLEIDRNGNVNKALQQLEEAGLVACDEGKNPETGEPLREKRYRLRDNYCRFYLKYIEPEKDVIDKGQYELGTLDQLEGWNAVKGLAFENLVVNNSAALRPLLGIGKAMITSVAPYRRAGSRDGTRSGLQVDLLLQTRRTAYLIEVKRKAEIGREVIGEMEEKVRLLPRRPGVSVRTALVYEGNLAPIVEADGYFDAIIPFRRLLGM